MAHYVLLDVCMLRWWVQAVVPVPLQCRKWYAPRRQGQHALIRTIPRWLASLVCATRFHRHCIAGGRHREGNTTDCCSTGVFWDFSKMLFARPRPQTLALIKTRKDDGGSTFGLKRLWKARYWGPNWPIRVLLLRGTIVSRTKHFK